MRYQDLGVDYYDCRNTRRQVRAHIQRLESLGFTVALIPPAQPHRIPRGGLTLDHTQPTRTRLRRVLPHAQLRSHFRVSPCAGMTLYQVLHELQIVLALILGACPLCCQPLTLDRIAAALTGT
jgi:hypothetical protein